jgi:hypothetical protein
VGDGKSGEGGDWVAEKEKERVAKEGVGERPLKTPTLSMLVANEPINVDGVDGRLMVSVSRLETMARNYYETAAVLTNGRWEVPMGGGSEGLEVGRCVNFGEDTIMLNEAKWEKKQREEAGEEDEEEEEEGEKGEKKEVRIGEIVETLNEVDAWPAARGRGFEDLVDKRTWRVEVRDERNGDAMTVGVDEDTIIKVIEKAEKKKKLKFDSKKGKGVDGMVCHRQGKRMLCGKKTYSCMVTVRLKEGGEWDDNIYIDVRVDVKRKEGLQRVNMVITGVEGRERVGLGGVAPAADLGWWSRPEREFDVWRPLVEDLLLVPQRIEEKETDAEEVRRAAV